MTVRSMTVGQKASLSLLFAVVLFAAFAVAAFSGLFDLVESRFYNPSISRSYEKSLEEAVKASDSYHGLNLERFRAVLGTDAVMRSFLPNMSAEDAFNRANAFGKLQTETTGLAGLRLVDSAGKRIHFSTFSQDIQNQSQTETIYRNYGDSGDRPFEELVAPEGSDGRVILDPQSGRFIYSLPFKDSFGVYRGSALFYVSQNGLVSHLLRSGQMSVGEQAVLAGDKGVILKVPQVGSDALAAHVAEIWRDGLTASPLTITEATDSSPSLVLFSRATKLAGGLGYIVPSSSFAFPASMKWLLLGSFFVTAYLLVFLILNLRQDKMTVLSDRIKRFQINLLEGYLSNKADIDFERWSRELEARRGEVKDEFKRSMGLKRRAADAEVDELIDKSWDEILAILGKKAEAEALPSGVSVKEVERLIAEAIKKGNFILPPQVVEVQAPAPRPAARPVARPSAPPPSLRPLAPAPQAPAAVEELEELGEAEPVEELEIAEAEPVEEAEAVEEVAEAETVEEAEAAEEIEEAEAAEEVAEAEAAEEVEEAEAAEEVAEVEAVEEAEAVEEVTEAEAAEEVAGLEAAEEAAEVEAAEEIAEAEAVEEVEEAEAVEEVAEEVAEAEVAEAEPVSDLEPLEGEAAYGDLRSMAAQALALASDTDDIPLIPESSGLELADEADISDIIGFIEIDEGEASEDLDFASPADFAAPYGAAPVDVEELGTVGEIRTASIAGVESGVEGAEEVEEIAEALPLEGIPELVPEGAAVRNIEEGSDNEIIETLEPLEPLGPEAEPGPAEELRISLGSLDLSELSSWEGGPAGAAEIDATRSIEPPQPEEEVLEAFSPELPIELPTELPLVSNEQIEKLEALPVFEPTTTIEEEPVDAEPIGGDRYVYFSPDRYVGSATFTSVIVMGDLPAAEDEDGMSVPEVTASPATAETRPEFDDEECEGPIVWRDGLWQVDQEGERLPVELDSTLKELADSVLTPQPDKDSSDRLSP